MNGRLRNYLITCCFSALMVASQAGAAPDVDAPIIALKLNCGGNNNCFTDTGAMLDWIWITRTPTTAKPLIVNVDAGSYSFPNNQRFCDNQGNVTVRGSGHTNTVLTGGGFQPFASGFSPDKPVLAIRNCTDLSIQDLTIRSDYRSGNPNGSREGILWEGGGSSTWSNIRLEVARMGWHDVTCSSKGPGTHYWFGSRIESFSVGSILDNYGYYSQCGDNWFYGGEIKAVSDGGSVLANAAVAANAETGKIQIFGSSVLLRSTANAVAVSEFSYGYSGIAVTGGGSVHMHGGIISVKASDSSVTQDVNGVKAFFSGGSIHTPDTAFNLKAGGNGKVTRVNGVAQSPYQWPSSATPPDITTADGSDTFVETDCDSTGSCDGGGNEPHMMIYSSVCNVAGQPWFDSSRGKCRGAP